MPKKTNKDTLKKNLISAMEDSLGVIKAACEACKCSRQTYYNFIKEDKEFKLAIEQSNRASHDYVRSILIENIKAKKEASVFFYMKTQMNWIEKTKMDLTSNDEPINIPPISWVTPKQLLEQ
tara:strand:- start:19771 stop:20136 length:366 start_codon:yes stop_codon:yes gene_type:complete